MARMGDLRSWLDQVDRMGELIRIDGADWDGEIGCTVELNSKRKSAPALLFENIKDYPKNYAVAASVLKSPSRLALTLNIPVAPSNLELMATLREKYEEWDARAADFPPETVTSGPVLENVLSGEKVDLLKFPVPKWHDLDGGRFIGTGDSVITIDPDTGVVNLGTYRVMVHDRRTTGLYMVPGHHGELNISKHHKRGERSPVAISVGHHPLILMVSSLPFPGCEYNYSGVISGEPTKVIKEEVTGLPIPADSEIVIAGFSPPDKTKIEGPFGEWTGYYGSKDRPAPIIEVERVYYRNNPILLGCPPSRSPDDPSYYMGLVRSAILHNFLTKSGVPAVKGVWLHEAAGGHPFIVISLKQSYPGHAKQAALLACQSRVGTNLGRYIIVVDEDIDPTNIDDVLWAMSFRVDPEKDIDIVRRAWSSHLDPMIRKPTTAWLNSRAIIDACKPYEWIDEFPKEVKANPALAARVRKKWGEKLGL